MKRWTVEESEYLEMAWKEGESDAEIAGALGRSAQAVAKRRSDLGLVPFRRGAWSKGDDARLMAMAGAGKSYGEISAALGRTECAVSHRTSNLGVKIGRPRQNARAEGLPRVSEKSRVASSMARGVAVRAFFITMGVLILLNLFFYQLGA